MKPHLEKANRALFEGHRNEVVALLKDRAASGAEVWLLAAALDDDEERLALLRRVVAIGDAPYAALAADILRRETALSEELRRGPFWQHWLLDHRAALIRISLAVLVISATLIILGLLFG